LFLAVTSLLKMENPEVGAGNQPTPVSVPAAISAPAKATPMPAHNRQPAIQPVPQPVPTPVRTLAVNGTPSAQNPLPVLLFGLLLIVGVLSLIVKVAVRLSWQRNENGRFLHQPALEGVQS
jgi:hypothetical protein